MPTINVQENTIELNVTKSYDKFNFLEGNRPIDPAHVARLRAKIEREGNLTSEFPVNVNEDMEVIDGQHRILALKELNYPVYYTITRGAGLSVVRQINVGRRNWTWKDYAASFAAEGNKHYKDLLDFHKAFGFGNHILVPYTNGGTGMKVSLFQAGDYKVLDRGLAYKLLNQLSEIRDTLPFNLTSGLASALYVIMTHPEYDHKRLVHKLTQYGSQLHEWRKKNDWLRNIEDVYNLSQAENTRVRFF